MVLYSNQVAIGYIKMSFLGLTSENCINTSLLPFTDFWLRLHIYIQCFFARLILSCRPCVDNNLIVSPNHLCNTLLVTASLASICALHFYGRNIYSWPSVRHLFVMLHLWNNKRDRFTWVDCISSNWTMVDILVNKWHVYPLLPH